MDARYANEGAYYTGNANIEGEMPILKAHTSCRLFLFLPMDRSIAGRATAASVIASVEASSAKKSSRFTTLHWSLSIGWRGQNREPIPDYTILE
jgi:hypothetical protein